MLMFFAGTEYNVYAKILKDSGVKRTLQSAFYLNYVHEPNVFQFDNYLLDSGGFSARNLGVNISVDKYVDFINRWKIKIAFNLDTLDVKETLENQNILEQYTDSYIIPVYHYTEFASNKYRHLLEQYASKYPYIGIGGTAEGAKAFTKNKKEFFDFCFYIVRDKVKLHGLAVTSPQIMERYPWFSVDSTSWLSTLSFGKVMDFKNGELIGYNSLKNSNSVLHHDQLCDMKFRVTYNCIKSFMKLEQHITSLWKARGVEWSNEPFK